MSQTRIAKKIVGTDDLLNDTKISKSTKTKTKKLHKVARNSETTIVKGKPKSGRFWKTERQKFSSVVKTPGLKNSFEKKQALREKLRLTKEASKERKAQKQEEEEQRKQRRRENLKRQEENRKKSEIVQAITNTKKLKKMKKKQLRHIEKRDTTTVSK